jgi:OmpA-OmpF porin, OOP family
MKTKLALAASLLAVSLAQAGNEYSSPSTPSSTPVMPKVQQPLGERFYIDLAGGAAFLQDTRSFTFDTGWSLTGAFGVNLGDGLSVELETGYLTSNIDGFKDGNLRSDFDISGDVSVVPILGNVKYTAPVTSLFNFYIGAGLGAIYTDGAISVGSESLRGDDWDFAFQGFAGISIPMSEILNFDLGYRFLGTGFKSDELRAHVVEAGISFKF